MQFTKRVQNTLTGVQSTKEQLFFFQCVQQKKKCCHFMWGKGMNQSCAQICQEKNHSAAVATILQMVQQERMLAFAAGEQKFMCQDIS
jgi:hypothetical protein